MPNDLRQYTPEELVTEIAELRRLSARAEASDDPDSRIAKRIFDKLIERLESRLANVAVHH